MIGGLVACAHSLWRGGRAGDAPQRERDAVAAPVRQTLGASACDNVTRDTTATAAARLIGYC